MLASISAYSGSDEESGKDRKEFLAFYDFPSAYYMGIIRALNLIESGFAILKDMKPMQENSVIREKQSILMVFELFPSVQKT